METEFLRKLESSNFFPPKNRWSPKKKRSSPKLSLIFRPKSEIQTFFQPNNRWSTKKQKKTKRKKVFTEFESDFSAEIGNSNAFSHRITTSTSRLRHPISFGGGCFQFFTKNRPKKQQKRAILHTSQAKGRARAPRPPLATLLITGSVSS